MTAPGILIRVICCGAALIYSASTQANTCQDAQSNSAPGLTTTEALEHTFESGASWSMCLGVDAHSGLGVRNIQYAAPNETKRKVLESASLAQILFKYDEDTDAQHWLSSIGLGKTNFIDANQNRCPTGEIRSLPGEHNVCIQHKDLNNLTSLRRSVSLRRNAFSIHAWSSVGAFQVEQVWQFTEDGQITPLVRLGGVLNRFTQNTRYGSDINQLPKLASNATMLTTWRLDFNINDTPTNDIVESIEFIPHESNVVRRSINISALTTESLHKVDRKRFKGWLVRDADVSSGPNRDTRIGYFIDPQTSGFSHSSRRDNWSVFDMALTRFNPCEILASGNQLKSSNCGDTLDDFVNGESVQNADPVIWFSVARQVLPKAEDFPAIITRETQFNLIPFDWSASTPFSPLTE